MSDRSGRGVPSSTNSFLKRLAIGGAIGAVLTTAAILAYSPREQAAPSTSIETTPSPVLPSRPAPALQPRPSPTPAASPVLTADEERIGGRLLAYLVGADIGRDPATDREMYRRFLEVARVGVRREGADACTSLFMQVAADRLPDDYGRYFAYRAMVDACIEVGHLNAWLGS